MSSRVSFYTFGCRLNQAETAAIARGFTNAGFDVVDFRDPADVVVVNTCTVTENGDADTRKLVRRIGREQPAARIALVGCQAQLQGESLAELPGVSWVVGNAEKMELPGLLNALPAPTTPAVHVRKIDRQPFTMPTPAIDPWHTRGNLKIQDGCDFFCLFCTIPYARGRGRSRVFDDLLREARELVAAGHRELVLTGVNVGTYDYEGKTVDDVVRALLEIDGLWRVRISSIEPTTIPESLLDLMHPDHGLCRYLHIPLQSGSDEVLRKMNRRYDTAEYRDFLALVADRVPGICLGADVLVGYPTETDAHFEETFALLRDLPLAYFHVFSYSERKHAKSHLLGPPHPVEVVQERSRRLRDLSNRKRRLYMQGFLGETARVLFEQRKDGFDTGLTDTYLRVKVPAGDRDLAGQLAEVRLTGIKGQAMTAELL